METIKDLLDSLPTKAQEECQKSLKDYLISIWHLLREEESKTQPPKLLFRMLEEACSSQTSPFDEKWLDYKELPEEPAPDDLDRFQFFKETILFQIADLHRIEQAGMLKESLLALYGGIKSPSGHSWYNFSPYDFIECGRAGFKARCERQQQSEKQQAEGPWVGPSFEATEFSWVDIAHLLQYGQMYE